MTESRKTQTEDAANREPALEVVVIHDLDVNDEEGSDVRGGGCDAAGVMLQGSRPTGRPV